MSLEHAQLEELIELQKVLDEYEARLAIKDEIIKCLDLRLKELEEQVSQFQRMLRDMEWDNTKFLPCA